MDHPAHMSPAPHAVVTRTSSGIGRAIAVALLAEGYRITGVDWAAAPDLIGSYSHLQCDLATEAGLATATAALAMAPAQVFVHAAGQMRTDAAPDVVADRGAALWLLHVVAPHRLAAALLPGMPDGVGRIVLLSSRASQGRAGRGLYAASKAGGEALVRSLALATLHRGITVNAVAPGPVVTAQTADPGRADAPVAKPPIGRMIAAEEIAATVGFLVSAAAGAITGQTLVQCGGLSLQPPAPEQAMQDAAQGGQDGAL